MPWEACGAPRAKEARRTLAEDSSVKRRLPAGLVDTGFASLATFIVGLTAVVRFDDVDRRVYALFFPVFEMGSLVANEGILTPAEVEAASFLESKRLSLLPRSLKFGIAPCLVGSAASLVCCRQLDEVRDPVARAAWRVWRTPEDRGEHLPVQPQDGSMMSWQPDRHGAGRDRVRGSGANASDWVSCG